MAAHRRDPKRFADDLADELRKIPERPPQARRQHLKAALEQTPSLVLYSQIHEWLWFGDLARAVGKLDAGQLREAGDAISKWLRDHDPRLNPDLASDDKPPVDGLRPDVHPYLSIDATALLGWQEFARAMSNKDLLAWADHLERRVVLGQRIEQASVPISVLRDRPDLAVQMGPLASARAAVAVLSSSSERDEGIAQLAAAWTALDPPGRDVIEWLGTALKAVDVEVLLDPQLPAPLKVLGLWEKLLETPDEVWARLDHEARVLAMYRAAKEGAPLEVSTLDEVHGLALAVMLVYTAAPEDRDVAQLADRAAATVVIEHGWVDPDPPSLDALIPSCPVADSGVAYCEGKRWDGTVWCPRLRNSCNESHVRPNPGLPWWRWTLLELMDARNVEWRQKDSSSWPNDLAGWLNRWHDLRERLRCSHCGSVMEANYHYSRAMTAAYGKTVMSCPTGEPGHDDDVYLSHCHGCSDPIDSRECTQRIDGFYLCRRCGSGPKRVSPGSVCAACGSANTVASGTSRWAECRTCHHKMHTPSR